VEWLCRLTRIKVFASLNNFTLLKLDKYALSVSQKYKKQKIDKRLLLTHPKEPQHLEELIEEIIRAGIWLEENHGKAVKIIAGYLGQEEEVIARSLFEPEGRTNFLNLYPNEDEYAAYQSFMIKAGI